MNNKKQQLEILTKYLLNRVTATKYIEGQIEHYLATDDEAAQHTFHKVMVHNWHSNQVDLFEVMRDYYKSLFIPVNCVTQGDVTTFHTSSLNFILKILKLDFMFPHARNMYNVDVLFNDKSSVECFEKQIKIEDIVASVVSSRFSGKMELDLSNFCEDPEFIEKNLNFYKLSLLSDFKILMLRMGRDARSLNLSNNNLCQVPVDIMNFFIKSHLIAVNLSNNNIKSVGDLHGLSSRIEKLWVEGNPLCDELEPLVYLKKILLKFPRLTALDGIRVNEHGMVIPFFKNFLVTPDKKSHMLIEKFLKLYFTHYDSTPRFSIAMFYDANAMLSISCNFTDAEEKQLPLYAQRSRNILPLSKRKLFPERLYKGRDNVTNVLSKFAPSDHDPTTFTVDLVKHDNKCLVVIVDGTYKETNPHSDYKILRFRRTFVIAIHARNFTTTEYMITNEVFHISLATPEQKENSFMAPRIKDPLALCEPDTEDIKSLTNVLSHLTDLKQSEAEMRLKVFEWDILKALNSFTYDLKSNKITNAKFAEDDDNFSDLSSTEDCVD